ncbi:hypothetical protein BH10PSE7_BH10PSE7_03310 [soil metagenome]
MDPYERINLKPSFEQVKVPCDGEAGDLIVLTPLKQGQRDPSAQGLASLWFCTKAADHNENVPAIWARVQFDGIATCKVPQLPDPPQNRPTLTRG